MRQDKYSPVTMEMRDPNTHRTAHNNTTAASKQAGILTLRLEL